MKTQTLAPDKTQEEDRLEKEQEQLMADRTAMLQMISDEWQNKLPDFRVVNFCPHVILDMKSTRPISRLAAPLLEKSAPNFSRLCHSRWVQGFVPRYEIRNPPKPQCK